MLSGIPKTTWIVEVRKLAVSESPVLSHMLIPVSSTEVKGTQCPEWSDQCQVALITYRLAKPT